MTDTVPASVDADRLTTSEKVKAVLAETEAKSVALRDTLAANELLQRQIQKLHADEEAALEGIRAAQVGLEEAKKRQTIQRYYRRRAEDDQAQRGEALKRMETVSPSLAQRLAAARGVSQVPTINSAALEELRIMAADTVDRAEAARGRRDELTRTLNDLVSHRLRLETATSRQLRHTEDMATGLKETKQQVRSETCRTASELQSARKLERELDAVRRRVDDLKGQLADARRHNERALARLKHVDGAVGKLQNDRGDTRRRTESEAAEAEKRAAEITKLRQENVTLIQWLLDDAPKFIAPDEREKIHLEARAEAERLARAQTEAERALGLPHHGHLTAWLEARRRSPDERETRLFDELQEAIERTKNLVGGLAA